MILLNIYSELYWMGRLDGLKNIVIGLAITCILISIIAFIIVRFVSPDFDQFYDEEVKQRKKLRAMLIRKVYWIATSGLLLMLFNVLIPTKNEYIFIVAGGKTINWIKQDSSIYNIPGKTTELIYQFLDKEVKNLKSK